MKVKQKGPEMEQLRQEGKTYREIAFAIMKYVNENAGRCIYGI